MTDTPGNYVRGYGGYTLSVAERAALDQQHTALMAEIAQGSKSYEDVGLIAQPYQTL